MIPASSRSYFGADPAHQHAASLAARGDVAGAAAELRRHLALRPQDAAAHSYLLFLLHYDAADPDQLSREHFDWANRHAPSPTPQSTTPGQPLRIGYVSPHLREGHPVMSFFEPVLRSHDRRNFSITVYSDAPTPDAGTARLMACATQWRNTASLSDEQLDALIRHDRIDILIDLAGHLAGNRLLVFARKPAPLQVTWIGYPNTTGLRAMDYRLTDDIADPPGTSDHLHSEKLIRLPHGFLCYQPPALAPAVSALPAQFNGHLTFGCFQYPGKITLEIIHAWAAILKHVPYSRLLLHHFYSDYSRIIAAFEKEGVDPHRLHCVGALHAPQQHLALYGTVDLAFDTFPYNGTTTICESLWMGVPVLTLSGLHHAARVGASILGRLDLEHFVTTSIEQYIDRAVDLARNPGTLIDLRATLRHRLAQSAMLNAPLFTRELEQFFLEAARSTKPRLESA